MAVRVRVSGNPRGLHLTGAGSDAFLHLWPEPDPRRIKFGCGFYFLSVGASETQKNLTPKRKKIRTPKETWKKLKTRKKPEKIPKETQKPWKKPIYKTRWALEPDPKPDGFRFGCQIQPDYIFSRVRFLVDSTRIWPVVIPSYQVGLANRLKKVGLGNQSKKIPIGKPVLAAITTTENVFGVDWQAIFDIGPSGGYHLNHMKNENFLVSPPLLVSVTDTSRYQ
jgi:hypothetical protein